MTWTSEEAPTCPVPSCGYSLTIDDMMGHDPDLFALAPDEGRTTIVCPSCGVTYHCQGWYRPRYTTALDEREL